MKVIEYIKKVEYDGIGFIWTTNKDMLLDIDVHNPNEPVRVRGWGNIQYMFDTIEEAKKF